MKEAQKYALEEELREKVLARIVVIQRWVRAKLLRCRFLHIRRSAITLQVHVHTVYAVYEVILSLNVCMAAVLTFYSAFSNMIVVLLTVTVYLWHA